MAPGDVCCGSAGCAGGNLEYVTVEKTKSSRAGKKPTQERVSTKRG